MIRKAVIPAAGYGTRLLPMSKAVPKEMLPVVDRPVIQYVVEEAVAAGIQDILIVVSRGKRAIEEHFDRHRELEVLLTAKGQIAEFEALRRLSALARVHFDWQQDICGLGAAIACARDHVGSEPFAVLLGDTLFEATRPVMGQLIDTHRRLGGAIVALERVPPDKVSRYGIVRAVTDDGSCFQINDLIEKPAAISAPSDLAIAGRYLLTADIFEILDRQAPGENGEIQLTDALNELANGGRLHGLLIEGRRHDIGSRLDWLQANIALALSRDDIGTPLRRNLEDLLRQAEPAG
jgi:UTP--glucose-1-phosphate uridylyltransferase